MRPRKRPRDETPDETGHPGETAPSWKPGSGASATPVSRSSALLVLSMASGDGPGAQAVAA